MGLRSPFVSKFYLLCLGGFSSSPYSSYSGCNNKVSFINRLHKKLVLQKLFHMVTSIKESASQCKGVLTTSSNIYEGAFWHISLENAHNSATFKDKILATASISNYKNTSEKKWSFPFAEEILDKKLHFLCSERYLRTEKLWKISLKHSAKTNHDFL